MDSSDEDFLPDPERYREGVPPLKVRKKRPPDKTPSSSEDDQPASKQRGLELHDDSTKGKCFFNFLSVCESI